MTVSPGTSRFLTLRRALSVLLIIVACVGAGFVGGHVGGKPSSDAASVQWDIHWDTIPQPVGPRPQAPVAVAAEVAPPVVTPVPAPVVVAVPVVVTREAVPARAPVVVSQQPALVAVPVVTPEPVLCQEDEPCWDPCTMGDRKPCEVPPAPVCQEDQPCWNECTMGNLGPCDQGATLPYGARFQVEWTTRPSVGCQAGYDLTEVNVFVYSPAGALLAQSDPEWICAPEGDPAPEKGLATRLPSLYRLAASRL